MPLEAGGSREAFSRNVAREVEAGKPQKQAVAIAYAQERRSDAASTRILVELTDDEDQFAKLVLYLKENSDPGHSFKVVVDPDLRENRREFYIDGDGAFRIHSLKEEKPRKDSVMDDTKIDAVADSLRRVADGVDALEKRMVRGDAGGKAYKLQYTDNDGNIVDITITASSEDEAKKKLRSMRNEEREKERQKFRENK